SRLRTNITPLFPLSIFCVRSNANAPGVTCLTVTGSKNARPCHFEAHSRTRLRQLPARQHGSESVDLGNFVEITVVGVEVTSERLESLSALNLHPWGSILRFDYRSEQGGETVQ